MSIPNLTSQIKDRLLSDFNERKIVKTISLKKVSAVAVASLGFGLLSVVPASAAEEAAGQTVNITLANANTATEVNALARVNFMANMTSITNLAADGTVTFQSALVSYPAGGFVQVTAVANATGLDGAALTDTDLYTAGTNPSTQTEGSTAGSTYVLSLESDATAGGTNNADYVAVTTAASTTVAAATFTFTPNKVGTYVLRVWHDAATAGTLNFNEMFKDITLTVTAPAAISASLSTAYQTLTTGAAADSTTDKVPARVVKTLGTTAAAAITVTLRDSANAVITAADAITLGATVSGDAGGVGATIATAATTTFANQCPGTQPVRVATSITYTDVAQIYFCASNQSGTSTITITATDADGVVTTIGSETISYYGAVASLSVTPVHSIIRAAGGTTGDATAQRIATTSPAAMVVTAKDSKGMLVGDLAASLSVTGTAGIGSITCAEDVYDTGTSGAYGLGGEGNYGCTVTSTGAAVSGGKDTVQIRIVDPADSTKYIYATTQNVTFGGAPSTVTMSFDKTSYTAGAKGVLTVTVTDSAGNPASDGVYATLFSGASTTNLTGSTPGAAVVVIGGKKTYDVYLPNGKGTANITNTLGATIASKAGATVSATTEVADPNAGLLTQIDALNAKIVALNALIAKIMKKLGVK